MCEGGAKRRIPHSDPTTRVTFVASPRGEGGASCRIRRWDAAQRATFTRSLRAEALLWWVAAFRLGRAAGGLAGRPAPL
ncbi:MAG: hypothetical protein QM630_05420, partial [Microbacterium sp.]